jgi:hypothetical protein
MWHGLTRAQKADICEHDSETFCFRKRLTVPSTGSPLKEGSGLSML